MNIKKALTSILFIAIMAMFISTVFTFSYLPTFLGLVLFSLLVPTKKGVAFMAVQVEIWQKDIIGNLFKDNQFAQYAKSGDDYVLNGAVVHIPGAGIPSRSKKNVTDFPITAVKRADADVIYGLDTVYQEPKFVEKVEQYELSYDKRQSIMGEQQSQLIQDAMDSLLYNWGWATPNNIGITPCNSILTTGAPTETDLIDGATGSRKTFTKDVIGIAKKKMDKANISPNGRFVCLTANHHQQFIDSLDTVSQTNFYRVADMSKGIVGTFLGFTFLMRSDVQRWRKVAGVWTPVDTMDDAFAGSDQTGDSAASLIWQQDCVERARGAVNVFDSAGRPEYYGDVFSMNMRFGGRIRRKEGVYSIIEDIVAP